MTSKTSCLVFGLLAAFYLPSCDWFKQKTKATVHKTGEVVAKTGSEFASGLSNGIEKSFQNEVVFSEALKKAGLQAGTIRIGSSDSTSGNVLTAYLIFDKAFDGPLMVKVFNAEGKEYGRVRQQVSGQENEARHIDFVFDKRTRIEYKSRILFE